MNEVIQPADWAKPRGYANAVAAKGRLVFVAGQIGWNERCEFVSDDFIDQCRQALSNVARLLREAGGGPEHMTRMTWYVIDKAEYIARGRELGTVYREVLGKNFPAMTAVQVVALMEDRAKVEIEVTAVVPD